MAALAVSSKAGLCAPRGLASRAAPAPLRPLRVRKVAVAAANSADREAAFEIGKMATLSAVASTWMLSGNAQAATELSQLAASDNRIGTIALLFLPAIGWVAFNMFQPAINQLNRMNELKDEGSSGGSRKRRGVASAVGLGAALSLFVAQQADAATELSQLAASDNRLGTISLLFLPALAWVGFNMLTPATNQLNRMNELKEGAAAGGSRKRR